MIPSAASRRFLALMALLLVGVALAGRHDMNEGGVPTEVCDESGCRVVHLPPDHGFDPPSDPFAPPAISPSNKQDGETDIRIPDEDCPGKQDPPQEIDEFTQCIPFNARCRRLVVDEFLDWDRIEALQDTFQSILNLYGGKEMGGAGPASLVDLNMGVVSHGEKFVSLSAMIKRSVKAIRKKLDGATDKELEGEPIFIAFRKEALEMYLSVVRDIHAKVSEFSFCDPFPCEDDAAKEAAIEKGKRTLFVAAPSFFSRLTRRDPMTANDQYWHEHRDREQYGSFAVTTLLYLSKHSFLAHDTCTDPKEGHCHARGTHLGGHFRFGGKHNLTVVANERRLSMFTSTSENPHWVEKVKAGTRQALTTAFTCDKAKGYALYTAEELGVDASTIPEKMFGGSTKKILVQASELVQKWLDEAEAAYEAAKKAEEAEGKDDDDDDDREL